MFPSSPPDSCYPDTCFLIIPVFSHCRSFSTSLFPFRFLLSCRLYPCPRLHRNVTTHSGLRLVDEMLHRFCRSLVRRCNLCPPRSPPSLILKLRGVLKDKRGEMTKCCITPVCTNIKTGGEKGGRQGACFPTPTQLGRIEERGSCNILSTNRLAKQFFDQNYMTI